MNIRQTTVPRGVPLSSTGMTYISVSLSCEPWNTPIARAAKAAPAPKPPTLEERILTAIGEGKQLITEILNGSGGSTSNAARTIIAKLMVQNKITRSRRHPADPYRYKLVKK